ncbi:hypothetical protein [Bacillus thuringiensis]|uniref:hypothetical protein n=1 Tax=Bacillus thuringiensis TaxID=1428 RepID=UPI0026E315E5|nr:hypothetical protein [Bacillus thuringiensis]MDO6632585.1 hypothetical protein [Bacillus thuringiensis]MDO6663370.1 hypothetical protein [Bacillus thuringiensis]MDO6702728.1 hypothetical protein [Bacillus thuringiensis]
MYKSNERIFVDKILDQFELKITSVANKFAKQLIDKEEAQKELEVLKGLSQGVFDILHPIHAEKTMSAYGLFEKVEKVMDMDAETLDNLVKGEGM